MNGLVTARSALCPQAGQIAVGGNTREVSRLEMSANLDDKEQGLAYKRVHAKILGSLQDFG
jgi:hypothetical protein